MLPPYVYQWIDQHSRAAISLTRYAIYRAARARTQTYVRLSRAFTCVRIVLRGRVYAPAKRSISVFQLFVSRFQPLHPSASPAPPPRMRPPRMHVCSPPGTDEASDDETRPTAVTSTSSSIRAISEQRIATCGRNKNAK